MGAVQSSASLRWAKASATPSTSPSTSTSMPAVSSLSSSSLSTSLSSASMSPQSTTAITTTTASTMTGSSTKNVPKLAMMAVGQQMGLRQDQLLDLLIEIKKISASSSSSLSSSKTAPAKQSSSTSSMTMMMISREDLSCALKQAYINHPQTVTLMDLLFTMWDQNGTNCIPGRDFVVGMTPLALSAMPAPKVTDKRSSLRRNHRGKLTTIQPSDQPTAVEQPLSVESILRFALKVVTMDTSKTIMEDNDVHEADTDELVHAQEDGKEKAWIGWNDLNILLAAINSTASYFGDPDLTPDEIQRVVTSVFSQDNQILEIVDHEDCIRKLMSSPYIRRFAKGKPRLQVQFKDVEDVVSYIVPTPMADENRIMNDVSVAPDVDSEILKLRQMSVLDGVNVTEMRKAAAVASLMDASSYSFDSTCDSETKKTAVVASLMDASSASFDSAVDDDVENSSLGANKSNIALSVDGTNKSKAKKDPPAVGEKRPKASKLTLNRLPIPRFPGARILMSSRDPPAAIGTEES